jgi:nucleoid-associated protein YgaU
MGQKGVKVMSNLKNIRQIGNPTEADKVYIEAAAYDRMHMEEIPEKRVFVLMGHTECEEQRYSTFVESVIPVWDISFEKNIPVWNNHVWNEVFQEIKHSYEDAVIVGWAVDIKGAAIRVTEELESVHREQFGGIHQLLLLMDSLEPEECFYQVKNNHLWKKEGFYIYYDSEAKQKLPSVQLEFPVSRDLPYREEHDRMREEDTAPRYTAWSKARYRQRQEEDAEPQRIAQPKARYRQLQEEKPAREHGKTISRLGVAVAAMLAIAILGKGLSQKQFQTVFSDKADEPEEAVEETEQPIPLVEIPGGVVVGKEEPSSISAEETTQESGDTVTSQQIVDADITASQDDEAAAEVLTSDVQETISYTVQKGDTLLGICRLHYGSTDRLTEIEQINNITDPDAIYVGQQLLLPQ